MDQQEDIRTTFENQTLTLKLEIKLKHSEMETVKLLHQYILNFINGLLKQKDPKSMKVYNDVMQSLKTDLPSKYEQTSVEYLREIIPFLMAVAYAPDTADDFSTRSPRGTWDVGHKPSDWPDDLPYAHPVNGFKDEHGKTHKLRIRELRQIATFLAERCQKRFDNSLSVSSSSGQMDEISLPINNGIQELRTVDCVALVSDTESGSHTLNNNALTAACDSYQGFDGSTRQRAEVQASGGNEAGLSQDRSQCADDVAGIQLPFASGMVFPVDSGPCTGDSTGVVQMSHCSSKGAIHAGSISVVLGDSGIGHGSSVEPLSNNVCSNVIGEFSTSPQNNTSVPCEKPTHSEPQVDEVYDVSWLADSDIGNMDGHDIDISVFDIFETRYSTGSACESTSLAATNMSDLLDGGHNLASSNNGKVDQSLSYNSHIIPTVALPDKSCQLSKSAQEAVPLTVVEYQRSVCREINCDLPAVSQEHLQIPVSVKEMSDADADDEAVSESHDDANVSHNGPIVDGNNIHTSNQGIGKKRNHLSTVCDVATQTEDPSMKRFKPD